MWLHICYRTRTPANVYTHYTPAWEKMVCCIQISTGTWWSLSEGDVSCHNGCKIDPKFLSQHKIFDAYDLKWKSCYCIILCCATWQYQYKYWQQKKNWSGHNWWIDWHDKLLWLCLVWWIKFSIYPLTSYKKTWKYRI